MKSADEIKKGLEGLKFIANAGRIDDALAYIRQLEAERDALIAYVYQLDGCCAVCTHYDKGEEDIPCRFCSEIHPEDEDKLSHWEWRGVQKEETP